MRSSDGGGRGRPPAPLSTSDLLDNLALADRLHGFADTVRGAIRRAIQQDADPARTILLTIFAREIAIILDVAADRLEAGPAAEPDD